MEKINNNIKNQQFFEDIDRIIHAARIEEIQELKRLVRFIDQLIQSLIHQITNGMLSASGAKIKILQCLNLVHHCQIQNHPIIKMQLNKLNRLFENTYKETMNANPMLSKIKIVELLKNKSTTEINEKASSHYPHLTASTIRHYIESIRDSNEDPAYNEFPNSMNQKTHATPPTPPHPKKNKAIEKYYLSTLFFSKKSNQQIMLNASEHAKDTPSIKKKQRLNQFQNLKKSTQHKITETA
jgi:hypothetical protein